MKKHLTVIATAALLAASGHAVADGPRYGEGFHKYAAPARVSTVAGHCPRA